MLMGEDNSYEEHVQTTNRRLVTIRDNLCELFSFPSACVELTQWCGDPRAFTGAFEENLLSALQVCMENGTKEEFDFNLAHSLISTCFQHRKLLSKNGANRINRWYEQYRRLKKSGGRKKKRSTEGAATTVVVPLEMEVVENGPMWTGGMQSPSYQMQPGTQYGLAPQYGMNPAGAPQYPADPNLSYEQNMQLHQQRLAMQQQMMMARRRAQMGGQMVGGMTPGTMTPGAMNAQMAPQMQSMPYDGMTYQQVPMGVNNVPGQSQPLMRMTSMAGMTSPQFPPVMSQAGRMGPSPGYPPGTHPNPQMIRAGPPVMFGQLQNGGQQQVMSYPNPNASTSSEWVPLPATSEEIHGYPICVFKEMILRPFTLQHETQANASQSFSFTISPNVLHQLQNPTYELELRCQHATCSMQQSNWPKNKTTEGAPSLTIKLNGHCLPVPTGENPQRLNAHQNRQRLHQALFVKQFIRPEANIIEFVQHQCTCSHQFVMRLVERRALYLVVQDMFSLGQKNGHSVDMFKTKLQQRSNGQPIRLSLFCPTTGRRMQTPARSKLCSHVPCFELEPMLYQFAVRSALKLPCRICMTDFSLEDIEIDLCIGAIIKETAKLNPQPMEVLFDGVSGQWKVVDTAGAESRKRPSEDPNGPTYPMKRIKSEGFPPPSDSPFPTANSVPANVFGQSPANALLSPFAANTSPSKAVSSSPSGARYLGGPGTPMTPGGNHPQQQADPEVKQEQKEMKHEQNGSVEANTHGSAPYTPASLNGGTLALGVDAVHVQQETDLENVVFDFSLTKELGDDYMKLYLTDVEPGTYMTPSWEDIQSIMSK